MNLLFCSALAVFLLTGCAHSKKNSGAANESAASVQPVVAQPASAPVTVDLSKRYPKKDFCLQDFADVSYLQLEATDESLLSPVEKWLYYVSDNLIVAKTQEDRVVLLDGKGRFKSSFLHKGNSGREYLRIDKLAVDETRRELFISDVTTMYRIQVYDFEGNYKRTLPLPAGVFVSFLANYSADCLLVGDDHISGEGISCRERPYFLLSKETGQVVKELDISFRERVSSTASIPGPDAHTVHYMKLNYNPVIRSCDGWLIGDVSMDTVCAYTPQGVLKPLLVRQPSVYDKEIPYISYPVLKTPGYFFIECFLLKFDFSKPVQGFKTTWLAYDYEAGETYEVGGFDNRDYPGYSPSLNVCGHIDSPWRNAFFHFISVEDLLDALAKGEVSGPLKDIASQLTEDSNPVLVVVRLKGCPSE